MNENPKMNLKNIAAKIIGLRDADLALRNKLVQSGELSEGYHIEMQELHHQNAKILEETIEDIGFPSIEKLGKEAYEASWLVVQHAIGDPDLMRKYRNLLEQEADQDQTYAIHLAYLTDRIAVLEGKLQKYGTQFDWDENGVLNPNPFDDLLLVNERRKSIDLNTLEEQTNLIRTRAKNENQTPPKNPEKRKQEMEKWRKKTGWSL